MPTSTTSNGPIRMTADVTTTVAHTGRRYQTRQKELVLACVREQTGSWVTARQVAELLSEQGVGVSTATIYRNLERLEAEGVIARGAVEGTGGACYRYLLAEPERTQTYFYLKCESCGRLMEIDCAELTGFYEHFSREHHIRIDPVKTVLYGTCPDCFDGHATAGETTGGVAGEADGETASAAANEPVAGTAPRRGTCSCPHCHPDSAPHP